MKTIQIRNMYSSEVIFKHKCTTIMDCIEAARKLKTDLAGADLREADLRGADLTGTNLRGADLEEADLRGADLREADLTGADLGGADLREADLRGADLREADLREADLRGADLEGANLKGANIDWSVLHFHCNHLKPKTDRRLRVQLGFHFASWLKHADNLDKDEIEILNCIKDYVNEFHRERVEKI